MINFCKNLKRCLLFFLISLSACLSLYAVPAYPGWVDFRQPDGSSVKVRLMGDEFIKYAETEDGYTLLYADNGALAYATLDEEQNLIASSFIASDIDVRSLAVSQFLERNKKGLSYSRQQIEKFVKIYKGPEIRLNTLSDKNPVVGNKKFLTILVEFSDVKFRNTKKEFENLLNAEGYSSDGAHGSVRDFYLENSFGQLDLTTDVAGIYTLSMPREFYGRNMGMLDYNADKMAFEALSMADSDVDLSDYDNDNDGIIDGVHIIYAGCGEEAGGGADCIWAHSAGVNYSGDGVRSYRYSCSPEIRGSSSSNGVTRIGVICHELGHVLGCKDYYDTDYDTNGRFPGTGTYDVMGSGSWNADGACPAHFNPYVKIYDFQWGVVQDGNKPAEYSLKNHTSDGFVRIDTRTEGEFFLLEYRNQEGFDKFIPGHGLMIYRSSENMSRMKSNTLNARHPQQFYIISASAPSELPEDDSNSYGKADVSAPFSDLSGHTEFTDFTIPSMKSWMGVETGYPITEIKEYPQEGYVHFYVSGGPFGGAYNFKVRDTDTDYIALEWNKLPEEQVLLVFNTTLEFGVPMEKDYSPDDEIPGGGKVLLCGDSNDYCHTNLTENTYYYYALYTKIENGLWTPARIEKGKTETGIIRHFPYVEDFSTGYLGKKWVNECIYGSQKWDVGRISSSTESLLIFQTSNESARQKSRIILPKIDFTAKRCAALSLDVRNWIYSIDVAYRTSSDGEWHILTSIDSDFRKAIVSEDEMSMFIGSEKHISIPLPNLNSNYELSIVGDFHMRGNVHSNSELASIDNVEIVVDYPALVSTTPKPFILGGACRVHVNAIEGLKNIAEKGVAWTIDGIEWNHQIVDSANFAHIIGLPINTTFYYKGYVKTDSDIIYGDISEATTSSTILSGRGSLENPYLIGTDADWNELRKIINSGNDCSEIVFAINNDFILEDTDMANSIFNGILDGRGHTLTLSDADDFDALIHTVGENGCVKNISLWANTLIMKEKALVGATVCVYNYGLIEGVNVKINQFISKCQHTDLAGICRNNFGTISDTHVQASFDYQFNDTNAIIWGCNVGGICAFNQGIISYCSFNGEISSISDCSIAGITTQNTQSNRNGKDVTGIITGCVNNATLKIVPFKGKSHENMVAGIVCSNYGLVSQCINNGSIIADLTGSGSSNSIGGITSYCSGNVSDCLNQGLISVGGDATSLVGGIAGYIYLGQIRNCVSYIKSSSDIVSDKVKSIVGSVQLGYIDNCWTNGRDYGLNNGVSLIENTIFTLDNLNEGKLYPIWNLCDGMAQLSFVNNGILFTTDHIIDFTESSMHTQCVIKVPENMVTGYQWRKKDALVWNVVEAPAVNNVINVEIVGLNPATRYELRYFMSDNDKVVYSEKISFATLFPMDGTKHDPVIIHNYDELWVFNELIAHGENFSGQIVKLNADIDLSSGNDPLWFPMQSRISSSTLCHFGGEFDGCGKVISNMKIDSGLHYVGFFGKVSESWIHDLTLQDAEITSLSTGTKDSGGVGGIVGFSGSSIIERCGFTGNIHGGLQTGGITGGIQTDGVIDCYVIGQIYGNYWAAGIVASGNAVDSYFCGSVKGPRNHSAISSKFGNKNSNCYYNASNVVDVSRGGDFKSKSEMMSDEFPGLLSENWIRKDFVNNGFPVPTSLGNSRVNTLHAKLDSMANVKISGSFVQGVDKEYSVKGFQWYAKRGETPKITEIMTTSNNSYFYSVIPNNQIFDEGINFRAVAVEDNDSIFGEWISFIPEILLPTPTIYSISKHDENAVTLSFGISDGNCKIAKIVLFYGPSDISSDTISQINLDVYSSEIVLSPISKDMIYSAFLRVETEEGYISDSKCQEFSLDGLTKVTEIGIDGIISVYSVDGICIEKATTLEDFMKSNRQGIYIINGRKILITSSTQ